MLQELQARFNQRTEINIRRFVSKSETFCNILPARLLGMLRHSWEDDIKKEERPTKLSECFVANQERGCLRCQVVSEGIILIFRRPGDLAAKLSAGHIKIWQLILSLAKDTFIFCAYKNHTVKTCGGVVIYLHPFLISALDGGEWSDSRPDR
jgi:hypothetical protein